MTPLCFLFQFLSFLLSANTSGFSPAIAEGIDRAVFKADVSGIHVQDLLSNFESLLFLEICGQSGNAVAL
jgi:hypothetical protein